MKKADRYFYPAVFGYEDGEEISVVFPDLDVATSGVNDDDALVSARELLGLTMAGLEEDGEPIPAPTVLLEGQYIWIQSCPVVFTPYTGKPDLCFN